MMLLQMLGSNGNAQINKNSFQSQSSKGDLEKSSNFQGLLESVQNSKNFKGLLNEPELSNSESKQQQLKKIKELLAGLDGGVVQTLEYSKFEIEELEIKDLISSLDSLKKLLSSELDISVSELDNFTLSEIEELLKSLITQTEGAFSFSEEELASLEGLESLVQFRELLSTELELSQSEQEELKIQQLEELVLELNTEEGTFSLAKDDISASELKELLTKLSAEEGKLSSKEQEELSLAKDDISASELKELLTKLSAEEGELSSKEQEELNLAIEDNLSLEELEDSINQSYKKLINLDLDHFEFESFEQQEKLTVLQEQIAALLGSLDEIDTQQLQKFLEQNNSLELKDLELLLSSLEQGLEENEQFFAEQTISSLSAFEENLAQILQRYQAKQEQLELNQEQRLLMDAQDSQVVLEESLTEELNKTEVQELENSSSSEQELFLLKKVLATEELNRHKLKSKDNSESKEAWSANRYLFSDTQLINRQLTPHVDQTQIIEQITQYLEQLKSAGSNQLTLNLEPDFLGKLNLNLALDDGIVTARFLVDTKQAKDLLEKNLPELRGALAQKNIQVDEIVVDLGSELGAEEERGGSANMEFAQDSDSRGQSFLGSRIFKEAESEELDSELEAEGESSLVRDAIDYVI